MDAFFVSIEESLNPELRGKAVIVGGDPGRGVVSAASYEARKFGVRSGMALSQAMKLCPQATFLRGDYERYAIASRRVFKILSKYTPDIEMVSIDEAYLDLTGFERLYGHTFRTAQRIKDEIKEKLRLNASIGIGTNRLIAKVASDCAKPNGILMVFPGYEKAFLAPLSVERLPGVGKSVKEKLIDFGVRKVWMLARVEKDLLVRTFGRWGLALHEMANGIDRSEVSGEYSGPKSISRETTLEEDTIDRELIFSTLFWLVERTAKSLREEGLQARTITLKLRYSDFSTVTRSMTLKEGTDLDKKIYRCVEELFRRAYTRRGRVRLLGVCLSNFCSPEWQEDFLDEEKTGKLKSFYQSVDRVRDKYGFHAIRIVKSSGGDSLV
jgi:DNA polymerase-4